MYGIFSFLDYQLLNASVEMINRSIIFYTKHNKTLYKFLILY